MFSSRRVRRITRALGAACLAVAVSAGAAGAQDTGTVSGTVVDTSGQVVPGATVTLTNEATADARSAVSDATGAAFTFRAVPPGILHRPDRAPASAPSSRSRTSSTPAASVDLGSLKLDVGTLSEVVSVVAEGATIETKNSDYSGLLTSTQISQIQSRGRDVVNLLRLLPGVHYEADIEAMGDSFGSQIPNIGGMRKHWNQVTVDGLNGNELSGTNRMNSSINLDAIAEVKVLLNTYKAEFGHSGGANIEIVSKSGSSSYQDRPTGTASATRGTRRRGRTTAPGLPKPKLHVDTPGFNLGGPVQDSRPLRSEGQRRSCSSSTRSKAPQVQRPGPVRLYRMPTALERQGDFSQTFDANGRLIFIKDPNVDRARAASRPAAPGCFPGNVIPAGRLDPNALALLKLMPLPEYDRARTTPTTSRGRRPRRNPRFNHLVRLDGRPSGNNTIWGSLRTWSSSQYGSEITAGPAKWGFFDGSYVSGDNSINGGWNHVFGSNGVNELSAGYRRATEGFGTKTRRRPASAS